MIFVRVAQKSKRKRNLAEFLELNPKQKQYFIKKRRGLLKGEGVVKWIRVDLLLHTWTFILDSTSAYKSSLHTEPSSLFLPSCR